MKLYEHAPSGNFFEQNGTEADLSVARLMQLAGRDRTPPVAERPL
jgi:hypothetical protein